MHNPQTDSSAPPSPFQDAPKPSLFFPGAQREEICQNLLLNLVAGQHFLHLNGPSGSGKTLLCLVFMERLPPEWIPVYLDTPASSYDSLIRRACIDLGAAGDSKSPDFSWPAEFNRQLLIQQKKGRKVVLVVDQGEQLFQAALERLIQRCRNSKETAQNFTLLLAGTEDLIPLLNRLAEEDVNNGPDSSYNLRPMTLEETDEYLRCCLNSAGISWRDHDAVLGEQGSAEIFRQAQGNCALTNEAARTVLAPTLSARRRVAESIEKPVVQETVHQTTVRDRFSSAAPRTEENTTASSASGTSYAPHRVMRRKTQAILQEPAFRWQRTRTGHSALAESILRAYDLLTEKRLLLGSLFALSLFFCALGLFLEFDRSSPPVGETGQTQTTQTGEDKAPEPSPAPQTARVPAAETTQPQQPAADPGTELFKKRLAASSALVAASYRGASTIHVLTVSGPDAQEQMVRLLTKPAFQQAGQQFYIVTVESEKPACLLFYGIFDTAEAARKARNSLPVELRVHHPYPLPVADALLLKEG